MAKSKKPANKDESAHKKAERAVPISSKDLPKKNLEDALKVPKAIKDNYGKQASWEQVAKAMEFSPNNPNNQYFLWSATAYGIVDKDEHDNYKITEVGRKILAPTYDGEDREGAVKAISQPSILGRFFSDYSSSQLMHISCVTLTSPLQTPQKLRCPVPAMHHPQRGSIRMQDEG